MKYGLPYMGSKSTIAKQIIDILQLGKRFIDLFGGGAAMSHAAAFSGKYEEILYFDIDPLAVEYVRRALSGYYSPENFTPWWVSREDFNHLKDIDPYVRYLWSFGNNPEKGYLFGRDIENEKKQAFCRKVSCEPLERFARVQSLEGLKLHIFLQSYTKYRYQKGDVVYCDPPYNFASGYSVEFDFANFLDWAVQVPCYVSSYFIADSRFRLYYEFKKIALMRQASKKGTVIERIYCSQYAAKEVI